MNSPKFLASVEINGRIVDFFEPPHEEPDFPWVDAFQLARAFLPKAVAYQQLGLAQQYGQGTKAISHDGKIVTIMCHAIAQRMCSFLDCKRGCDIEEDGPVFNAYSKAMGSIVSEHVDMSVEDISYAFRNSGGKYMRDDNSI